MGLQLRRSSTSHLEAPKIDFPLWPKQALAFLSVAREILYGGAAGPGKSHLMRVVFIVFCCAIPGLQAYLFRRHYSDLIKNHMEGHTGFREMLAPLVKTGHCSIVDLEVRFWNGSKIYLCHCQHEKDVENHRGAEIHLLGIEEATQFTEFMVRFLRHRVRMPIEMRAKIPKQYRELFPRILYTSNPGGEGHAYFKKWFVDAAKALEIWTTPDSEGGFSRQFIPARLTDNPSIDPEEYRKTLRGLGSPELVKALEEGNWDAIVGAFYTEFSRELHVIPDFKPPEHWFKFRSFDWGSYRPFAVGWFCVSDGEAFISNGKKFIIPRGAIVLYREWYGKEKDNVGLGLRNEDIAYGIKQRTEERNVSITLADSLPFQDRGGKKIADTFAECGVPLTQADDSRIPGWSQLRSRLIGNKDDGPLIYFCESCLDTIRTLPLLQRDIKKVETIGDGQEDHAADMVRYACMARPLTIELPKPDKPLDLSKPTVSELLQQHFKRRSNVDAGY